MVVLAVGVGSLGLSGCVADPPPLIGIATAGDGQAVVSWRAPLAAPAPITANVVTPWVGSARQTPVVFGSTATTQTVTGLTNGVTYTFTVHAVNALGNDSAESGMSNPVTPRPAVGPELPVSDPVYGPNRHDQRNAQVAAFDGTNYLVVWQDKRAGSAAEIWGARVAPDGSVLDVAGIPIARGVGGAAAPDVAFDGTNYLVVWDRGAPSEGVAAARVSPTGVVLDPTPIPIVTNATVTGPRVSAGNGSSLVAWATCSSQCDASPTTPAIFDIVGKRVASDGTVLDGSPIVMATTAQGPDPFRIDVAFDGTNYLVAFAHATSGPPNPVTFGIGGRRVSGTGAVLGSQFEIATGFSFSVSASLAYDGTNFFAVWSYIPSVNGRVRGARVSPAGTVLDPSGFDVSTAVGAFGTTPAVAFDGANTLVAWVDGATSTVLTRRIDSAGTPVDPSPVAVAAGDSPALAAGNSLVLVTFVNGSAVPASVEAVRLDSGTILDNPPLIVSTQANDQTTSAIAPAGTGSFVVWEDDRAGPTDIYGGRVQNGSTLDGTGIAVSTAANSQTSPAMAFDGTNYLVVWDDARSGTNDVYGARVSASGVVLDPGGIQITNTPSVSEGEPAVAFDGTNYLVVWDASSGSISGARVSTSGTVLDPGGLVLATVGTPSRPTVAFGVGSYFVAWQTNGGTSSPDIAGERVGTNGAVLDPAPIPISNGLAAQDNPQLAFNGTDYLVVWEDQRTGSATDIYGARVTPAGAVLDPSGIAISTAADLQREPQVAANGEFFVVWRDDRTRGHAAEASDIFGARVTDTGVVRDPSGVSIANLNQDKRQPVVTPSSGANASDVAYTRFAAGPQYGSLRLFHKSVAPN